MSIATELQDLNDNILDAYTAVQDKGGTVPANKNTANLPTAISSISGGGVGIPREIDANGVYMVPAQNFTFSLPSDATDVARYALQYAFQSCPSLTSVSVSSLTAVSGIYAFLYAFNYCSNLASVTFSSLATVSGSYAFNYAFRNCARLTSASFPALTIVSGANAFTQAFQDCRTINLVDFGSLATVSGGNVFYQAFSNCSGLPSVSFPALTTVSGNYAFRYAFRSCSSLTSLSFPALTASSFGSFTNQFNYMLDGCSGVTVHFPAAVQSTIENWSDVTAGFGGTNTTVLYDL